MKKLIKGYLSVFQIIVKTKKNVGIYVKNTTNFRAITQYRQAYIHKKQSLYSPIITSNGSTKLEFKTKNYLTIGDVKFAGYIRGETKNYTVLAGPELRSTMLCSACNGVLQISLLRWASEIVTFFFCH